MPPDPPGEARPAGPVVLRIKLRYDDVEAMINRFAPNVGKSGLFLPTRSLQPVGSEIKFELRLANDTAVLLGLGRVKATKPPDPDNPKASFGMAIELMRVTRESRDLILKMLERRKQLGLPEVTLPMPADVDASRRADFVETGVKEPASAPVPAVVEAPPSDALLTAPRRASGPIAVQKTVELAPLAPEPPRKKRPALQELIERASGPVSTVVPGLDEDVDVGAVLARARALAGGDLDGELEALREAQAAPIAIDVEAASAELARQLGGVAVRRGQSGQSWAPPPEIVAKVETTVEPEVEAAPEVEAKVEVEPELVPEPPPAPIAEPAASDAPEALPAAATEVEAAEHEVEPDQIDDEIHQLAESDFEEVEHTHVGNLQVELPPEPAFETTPALQAELADKLDEQLEAAEQESEHDDLGIAEASGHYLRSKIGLPPAEIFEGDDSHIPEPPPDREVTPLPVEYQQDFIQRFDEPEEEPVLLQPPAFSEPEPEPVPDDEVQEIDDFEILAEADEADADLLASSGEAELSARPEPAEGEFTLPPEGEPPLRESDFAMRLDLGDDDDFAPPPDLAASAGDALAGFDDDESHAQLAPIGFTPPGRFDQSDVIPLPDPRPRRTSREPSVLTGPPPNEDWDDSSSRNRWKTPPPQPPASEDIDLESALEALDVDLDDLSAQGAPVPHAATELARAGGPLRRATIRPPSEHQVPSEHRTSNRIPRGRAPRASTEDGVMIDFDDDDE